jgi:hypothetical protein
MLLIGFGNKARQGKDSAANAIAEYYQSKNDMWRGLSSATHTYQVKIGIFKFATALYEEVNDALKRGIWTYRHLGNPIVDSHYKPIVELPDWVQPEPNPEISTLAPYGKHPKLLQFWGTEFRRSQDPDYWTKKLFASIPANLDIAMVTDVRFPNEADGIKQRGGYNVNIVRLREDGTQYYSSDRPVDHPSETALDGYNFDFYLKIPHGHAALAGEFGITLTEYLRGLHK